MPDVSGKDRITESSMAVWTSMDISLCKVRERKRASLQVHVHDNTRHGFSCSAL